MKHSRLFVVGGLIGIGLSIIVVVMRVTGGSQPPVISRLLEQEPKLVTQSQVSHRSGLPVEVKGADDTAPKFKELVVNYRVLTDIELEENKRRIQEEIDSRELIDKANRAQLSAAEAQDLVALLRKSDAIAAVRVQRLVENLE